MRCASLKEILVSERVNDVSMMIREELKCSDCSRLFRVKFLGRKLRGGSVAKPERAFFALHVIVYDGKARS